MKLRSMPFQYEERSDSSKHESLSTFLQKKSGRRR
jgi:hypothetical protein